MTAFRGVAIWLYVAFLSAANGFAQPGDIGEAPGLLVDVGGRTLHINCSGSGSPTVILEAVASSFALDWSLVQPEIARTHRVCSYDRAGSGWSDPRGEVDTPARVVRDLHTLLSASGEKSPFVLVGASMGGVYVRLYQLEYPNDVAGIVFVDASTEEGLFAMFQGRGVAIASLTAEQLRSTLSVGPVAIPRRSPQTGTPFDRLPPELYQLRIKLDQRLIDSFPPTVSADIVRESSEGQRDALAKLLASRNGGNLPLRDRPVVVLTRGDLKGDAQALLSRLSTNSRQTVVADAGHEIHLFAPSVVVQAIHDVAMAAGQQRPLPQRP
jgi:pimeloyl-ACP methyl ester carboxylesterase